MAGFGARLKHAWDSFLGMEDERLTNRSPTVGGMTSYRPDRVRPRVGNERTIVSSIYTRLSVDVAGVKMEHVRLNDEGQYTETIKSGLNECLNVSANIDQAGRHFRQDIALTLFNSGVAAIIPIQTNLNPLSSGNWDIKEARVGEIINWEPEFVTVRAYNQHRGYREDLRVPKKIVAIVENPFYAIMNEPNSTLQRLIHKLALLDHVDEISSSGKLDIIIQLPYVVKSETRRAQANKRRDELQEQLQESTYGIAYTDGSEKITQLNRAVENNLLEQVKYLQAQVYTELGLTPGIMDGTADANTMLNYRNRIIEPIMDAIVEAMIMKFLTKTARAQNQTIQYFEQPFKMLPVDKLAEVTDVLSRNQIVTPNEVRPALGLKPSKQPQADQLLNSNMPLDKQVSGAQPPELEAPKAALEGAAPPSNLKELLQTRFKPHLSERIPSK